MIPRTARLSRDSFALAWKSARRKQLPFGQLLFAPAPDLRVSIVVSKKVEKTAVGRNRLKRRFYALMSALHRETPLSGHMIIVAGPGVRNMTLADIATALKLGVQYFSQRPG